MKRFFSFMLIACFLLILSGCAGVGRNATIVEGKTSKSEILSQMGDPDRIDGPLSNADVAKIPSEMKSSLDGVLSNMAGGAFTYDGTISRMVPFANMVPVASITLIQKDGTGFSTHFRSLMIFFDNKGIVSKVDVTR